MWFQREDLLKEIDRAPDVDKRFTYMDEWSWHMGPAQIITIYAAHGGIGWHVEIEDGGFLDQFILTDEEVTELLYRDQKRRLNK